VGAILAASAFTVGLANAAGPEIDPKVGRGSYFGTGSAERAQEYAELQIDLGVSRLGSAADVARVIDAESAPIWRSIAAKSPSARASEMDRSFWTSIVVSESEGSRVEVTRPNPQTNTPGSARRIDNCSGRALPLEAAVPSVYGGTQRLGIRSSDLDRVEALARTLNERPQNPAKTAVRVTHQGVRHDLKADTKRVMYEEVLGKAREAATGAGSQFESDWKTLKFASAHFLGHRPAFDTGTDVQIGDALACGQAPKVTLPLPLGYTVYAEAADVVNPKGGTKGLETAYEIQGRVAVDADYASTDVTVSVNCQVRKEDATRAIGPTSGEILASLTRFQGDRRPSETDKLVDNEASAATAYYPYLPIEWDPDTQKTVTYLDLCTQRTAAAVGSGRADDMPAY
jgi:hypothetical protein